MVRFTIVIGPYPARSSDTNTARADPPAPIRITSPCLWRQSILLQRLQKTTTVSIIAEQMPIAIHNGIHCSAELGFFTQRIKIANDALFVWYCDVNSCQIESTNTLHRSRKLTEGGLSREHRHRGGYRPEKRHSALLVSVYEQSDRRRCRRSAFAR